MTILRINHETTYSYAAPVTFGRHRVVLRPREGHDIRVEQMKLTIHPAHEIAWTRDVFGNSVALVDFLEPADTLAIVNDVRMHRHPMLARERVHPPWSVPFPVVYDALESVVAAAYRATSYQEDTSAVRAFLERHKLLTGKTAEALLDRINDVLYKEIAYNRRPEKGVQTPIQTLEKRTGSCRDLATLMMESCRALGIAARFASGYLDCPASTAGRASTHAWIEAYLPELGWTGFDPTIGQRCSHKHITCGLSNHPRGVMPISGTFNPTPEGKYRGMNVAVRIEKE